MKWYICHIEKTVIDLCAKFGLNANTSPHTGVWIGDNKVRPQFTMMRFVTIYFIINI